MTFSPLCHADNLGGLGDLVGDEGASDARHGLPDIFGDKDPALGVAGIKDDQVPIIGGHLFVEHFGASHDAFIGVMGDREADIAGIGVGKHQALRFNFNQRLSRDAEFMPNLAIVEVWNAGRHTLQIRQQTWTPSYMRFHCLSFTALKVESGLRVSGQFDRAFRLDATGCMGCQRPVVCEARQTCARRDRGQVRPTRPVDKVSLQVRFGALLFHPPQTVTQQGRGHLNRALAITRALACQSPRGSGLTGMPPLSARAGDFLRGDDRAPSCFGVNGWRA